MQWYSPFRRINSGTRFGHTPAALRCRRRHLAALPASGPGASASAGGAPALLGASASAGGTGSAGGFSCPGFPRSSRAERKEKRGWCNSADGLLHMSPICRYTCPFWRMVCTCPFRRMVCYTLHSWGCLTPPKRARIALGEQGRRPFPWLVCTTATCACVAALGPSITSLPNSAAPICPFRRMVREAHNLSFWRLQRRSTRTLHRTWGTELGAAVQCITKTGDAGDRMLTLPSKRAMAARI